MITCLVDLFEYSSSTIFWASAIVGTTFFVLRMLMALVGGSFEVDDGSLDGDMHDTHHDVPSFKLFTLHSISGFFMMFGLVGLACTDQFDLSYVHAFAIASVVGVSVMVLIALIFRSALLFQGSGTVFTLNKTVGLVGTVYQRIPSQGQGKVSLVVNGISREVLAQSADKKSIESFKIVKVIKVIDHDVVEVAECIKDTDLL